MWVCLAYYIILGYIDEVSHKLVLKEKDLGAENAILLFLYDGLLLEPINIFLYSWRFLATLAREEENVTIGKFYSWFATIAGWLVPIVFVGLSVGY